MAKTTRIHDIEKIIHKGKIDTPFAAVPFTTIVNEQGDSRKMADLSQNLKVSMGVERIIFNSINSLTKEFGPSGQVVSEISNGDHRVRFVGDWRNISNTEGTFITHTSTDGSAYMEVTFYGTGLNVLAITNAASRDGRPSINGGVEGTNIYDTGYSAILNGKNSNMNQVISVASGLSLGWHTVKLRSASSTQGLYEVEILNEQTQLVINQGQPFQGGLSAKLISQQLLDYSPIALTGTKGGRVKTYLTEEGTLGQSVTVVDVAQANLASTDHSNEEITRQISFREFGRNLATDFSTLSTGAGDDRIFTLNDGTTSLVGNQVRTQLFGGSIEYLTADTGTANFFTLTFVGTGLDVVFITDAISRTIDFIVDGTSIGTINKTSAEEGRLKIVSGLPYGTHTVKFLNTSGVDVTYGVKDFIIYQPKEPSIPENAIELADYNVLADYSQIASIASRTDIDVISTGILRKVNNREILYNNTWSDSGRDVLNYSSGLHFSTVAATAYYEYTFFGTGIEIIGHTNASAIQNMSVTIDGAADLSGFTTNLISSTTGVTWTDSTGLIAGTAVAISRHNLSISGLPLGKHTIRVTRNGNDTMYMDVADIITPIHINNTEIGSMSLQDLRVNAIIEDSSKEIDLSKAKAYLVFDGVNNKIISSHNISAIIDVSTGVYIIWFKQPFKDDTYLTLSSASSSNLMGVQNYPHNETQPEHQLVRVYTHAGAVNDGTIQLAWFGELENEENLNLGDL